MDFIPLLRKRNSARPGGRNQCGPFLPDHLPRPGYFHFSVQQLQEAAFTTHLKLPGTAFQGSSKGSRGSCLWWLRLDLIEQSPGLFDPWCFSVHFSRKVNSRPEGREPRIGYALSPTKRNIVIRPLRRQHLHSLRFVKKKKLPKDPARDDLWSGPLAPRRCCVTGFLSLLTPSGSHP